MRIAVCDDDLMELSRISALLDSYKQEKKVPILYKTYQSSTELLSTMRNFEYDLFLLDIMMPGVSGIGAAKEIRESDKDVKIVFLTSSPEFALESYAVKAQDYLLKPPSKDKLFPILDQFFSEEQSPREGMTLKTRTGVVRILFSRLAFVEVMGKKLYFHMADGGVREVTATLSEFEERLSSHPEFMKVHRSCIVNLWQVDELTPKGLVTFSGETVPVSRLLYSDVREAYMEHLFIEKGLK